MMRFASTTALPAGSIPLCIVYALAGILMLATHPGLAQSTRRAAPAGDGASLRTQLDAQGPNWLSAHAVLDPAFAQPTSVSTDSITTPSGTRLSVEAVDRFITAHMDALEIPGLSVAIINDGEVVYHRALGVANTETGEAVTDRSVFEAASLSKPVSAYFILKMVEAGVIDLDTPLHTYVPLGEVWNGWYVGLVGDPRAEAITARMGLSHQTGLPNWRWETDSDSLSLQFDPGTQLSYSSEGYELVVDVIAHEKGLDLEGLGRLMQHTVLDALGMANAAYLHSDTLAARKVRGHENGQPLAARWCCDGRPFLASGNLHTEARSYAQFLIALINGTGLTDEHAAAMRQAQVPLPDGHPRRTDEGIVAWSLGLAIVPTPYGTRYQHGGTNPGFRTGFAFYLEPKIGHVLFTNSDQGSILNARLEAFLMDGTQPAPSRP